MNPPILSATVGLLVSLGGGGSTFAASWLAEQARPRTYTLVQQSAKREALYAEFIIEAAKRIAEPWRSQGR